MKFLFKRITVCTLAFCFCLGAFFIPAAAASDDLHSYIYLDFDNLGYFTGTGEFTVYGNKNITSNTVYVLCSEDPYTSLTGYVNPGGNTVTVERLWKHGSIACYKVKSTTAASFNHTFNLSASYNNGSYGILNVYRVFSDGAAGITPLDASGLLGSWGMTLHPTRPEQTFAINYLPYVFQVPDEYSTDSTFYFDVDIPISKLIGFDQVSFSAYADPDHGYSLDSLTVLYAGAPISYELTSQYLGDISDSDSGGYVSVLFNVPQQIGSNSYITLRFIWDSDNNPYEIFSIKFLDLYGRYSFVKSEYELLLDISKNLEGLNFDTTDLEVAINSLKTVLHSDLADIQSGISETNTLLESIRNYIANFRTLVSTGFANVGTWFSDLGTNLSALISDWGQNIVDAIISTNDDAADDFVDKSEQQSSDISDSMDKIDDIVTPDIDDIINPTLPPVDPGDPLDPTDPNAPTEDPASKPVEVLDPETVGSFAGVFEVFFENGMFSSIFSFVLLMMLASYVLFGKK